ncbi:hypothetical protein D3C86_1125830 [compost metagenome]
MDAGGRAHVDDVVGGQDGLLVMLDHQDRVAEVAQAHQAFQQAGVVALVQADGGFVQHVEDAGQAGADLRGQADALALAARQGAGTARQAEVVQADVVQEAQPVGDLLQDAAADLALLVRQVIVQGGEPQIGLGDRQPTDVGDVGAADLDGQGLGLQALAAADLAGRFGLIAAQLLTDPGAVGLAPAAFQIGQDAFEGLGDLVLAGVVVIDELDLLAARTLQDDLLGLFRQVAPGLVHREAVVLGQGLEGLGVERRGAARPRGDGALVQGLVAVRDHQIGVEGQLDPQAVAGRAGAEGVVEREQPRLDLADGEARDRAGELFGKDDAAWLFAFRSTGPFGGGDAVGQVQRRLDAVGVARLKTCFGYNAIHDNVDVVLELLVERGGVLDGVEFAVDLQPLEALTLPLGHLLLVLALAAANDGSQQQDALAVGQGGQLVDHLADGLALDRQAGGGRIGDADARPQQAHIVVNLGDRADGRARVLGRRLLFDGDGRRQALDQVDVRLAHQFQELARIGAERLDIAALALGVDGVERQRGLARPRQPGHHDQLLARDIDVHALEVVLAGAANADEVVLFGHGPGYGKRERGRPRKRPGATTLYGDQFARNSKNNMRTFAQSPGVQAGAGRR